MKVAGLLNKTRYIWGLTGVVLIAVIGGLIISSLKAATNSIGVEAEIGSRTANVTTVADTTASSGAFIKFASACVKGGVCTKADVAMHNQPSNCWVYYGTNVYNVTSYINSHPGGSAHFPATTVCGNNVGTYLGGTSLSGLGGHNHSSSAYTILASYLYATLIP